MLIAKEKRNSNIAEYLLYMWQVEDLIRAHRFNMDHIEQNLISQYQQPDRVKNEIRDWFANLMLMMYREGIVEKGHLSFLNTLVSDLNDAHLRLLGSETEVQYHRLYNAAHENIAEFRKKQSSQELNDVETCLTGLYGLLLLRLRKQPISRDTEQAMATFSKLLSVLSRAFLESERGEREW